MFTQKYYLKSFVGRFLRYRCRSRGVRCLIGGGVIRWVIIESIPRVGFKVVNADVEEENAQEWLDHQLDAQTVECIYWLTSTGGDSRHDPTDPLTMSKLQNSPDDALQLHKILRFPDFEAKKFFF